MGASGFTIESFAICVSNGGGNTYADDLVITVETREETCDQFNSWKRAMVR